jgi:hypothetical protein
MQRCPLNRVLVFQYRGIQLTLGFTGELIVALINGKFDEKAALAPSNLAWRVSGGKK